MVIPGFVAGVVGFLLGWGVLGTVASIYLRNNWQPESAMLSTAIWDLSGLFMANLIFGLLVARAGSRRRILTFMKGFASSFFIGFLIYSSVVLFFPMMAWESFSITLVVEILLKTVFTGALGAIAANMLYLLQDPIEKDVIWDR